jgi:YD repeat-containing protein
LHVAATVRRALERLGSWLQLLLVAASLFLLAPIASSDVRYMYDAAGRLVQVVAPDGSSARYRYDAAGNIVGIDRFASNELSLTTFSPSSGSVGAQVKLQGSGFSTTPASNTVTFNGVAASVISATPNEIIVTVPSGAITGPVTLAVGGNSVTSSDAFVVTEGPIISGFSPAVVNTGGDVTVAGSALEPVEDETQVVLGLWLGMPVSYSNTALTFTVPAGAGSGPINVSTSQGRATTPVDLIVLPAAVPAANVETSAQLAVGGGPGSLAITPGKHGVLAIRATQGQYLSVQLASLTTTPTSSANVGYQIYSPTNALLGSGSVSATNKSIHLPKIAFTGTHLVVFSSGTNTVTLSAAIESSPVLTGIEPTVAASTTSTYQSKRFILRASAGDDMGVGVSQLATAPTNVSVGFSVVTPTGSNLGATSNCSMSLPGGSCNWWDVDMPLTGDYVIRVASNASTATFNLTASKALTGTLTPGAAQSISLERPGQFALYDFDVGVNDTLAVFLGSVLTAPANNNIQYEIVTPSGSQILATSGAGNQTKNLRNLAAGTYRVAVVPFYGLTTTASVTLAPGLTASVASDAVTRAFSTSVPGQIGYFTFSATAGQNIGVGLSNLISSPSAVNGTTLVMVRPDGGSISGSTCTSSNPAAGCQIWTLNVPQTGDYRIEVKGPATATISFNLTVSTSVGGAITSGAPQTMTAVPGQFGVYTFTATEGQSFTTTLTAPVTTPLNQSMNFSVYRANGTAVSEKSGASTQITNLDKLAAGTYRIVVVPWYGVPASAQISLVEAINQSVPTDGVARHFDTTLLGQTSYFTFAATAGQNIGVGTSNFTATPSASASLALTIYRPDGVQLTTQSCQLANSAGGNCNAWALNIPQTGNYRLAVTPNAAVVGFDVTISTAATGALSAGVAQAVSLASYGQIGVYTFTATAGQNVAVSLSSITTGPTGQQVSLNLYNASGTLLGSSSGAGNRTMNLTNLAAGTYRAVVVPWYGVTVAAQLLYQ